MKPNPKQEAAQARCQYWIDRLGMAEWAGTRPDGKPRVIVVFRTKKKMDDAVGSCQWLAEECTATVSLLTGQGDETLVHELLHLHLEGHTTYKPENYSELHERALNRLAKTLVEMDRKEKI